MLSLFRVFSLSASLALPFLSAPAQTGTNGQRSAVLVELFTSEGCSSCPPADALLRRTNGSKTAEGQLIVGLSEHVNYWDGLGWRDPYSSQTSTDRQNVYGAHFGLGSVYTPQMVVNGREQLVGSDARALQTALAQEAGQPHATLHILSAQKEAANLLFTYSAADLPQGGPVDLLAVLVDDADRSDVLRGENSGRDLIHVSVARSFAPLGTLRPTAAQTVTLPLPPALVQSSGTGHHLVLFAQARGTLAVAGVDTHAF